MRMVLEPITVSVDGRVTSSETTVMRAGPHVVVVTTALPDIPLTVTSTFIGAQDIDTTIVDVTLGRRPSGQSESRTVPRDHIPVTHAHDRCLLEHAAAFQAAVARMTRAEVSVDVSEAALEMAAAH